MKCTWNQLDTESIKTVLRSEVKALREHQPANRTWLSSHFYEAFEHGFQACEKVSRIISKAIPTMHSGSRLATDLLRPAATLIEANEPIFRLVIELGQEIDRKVENGRSELVSGKVALVKRHFLEMCKRCHYTHYDARRFREIKSAPPPPLPSSSSPGNQTKSSPIRSRSMRKQQHEPYKQHKFEKHVHHLEKMARRSSVGGSNRQYSPFQSGRSSTRVKCFLLF